MKSVLEILRRFEQSLLFLLMVVYLNGFWIVFDEQMRTNGWVCLIWLVQFFGFGTLYAMRAKKKGWIIKR